MVKSVVVSSLEETHRLGKKIGQSVKKKLLIKLTGDLGTGKTAFVQGLAQGLEIPNAKYVASPTFTLMNQYSGRLSLYHADLYRLDGPQNFDDIGLDDILDADGVIAIEWAEKCGEMPETESLSVHLEFMSDESEDTCRRMTFSASGAANRLCEILDALFSG